MKKPTLAALATLLIMAAPAAMAQNAATDKDTAAENMPSDTVKEPMAMDSDLPDADRTNANATTDDAGRGGTEGRAASGTRAADEPDAATDKDTAAENMPPDTVKEPMALDNDLPDADRTDSNASTDDSDVTGTAATPPAGSARGSSGQMGGDNDTASIGPDSEVLAEIDGDAQRGTAEMQTALLNKFSQLGFTGVREFRRDGANYLAQAQTADGEWVDVVIDAESGTIVAER